MPTSTSTVATPSASSTATTACQSRTGWLAPAAGRGQGLIEVERGLVDLPRVDLGQRGGVLDRVEVVVSLGRVHVPRRPLEPLRAEGLDVVPQRDGLAGRVAPPQRGHVEVVVQVLDGGDPAD